MQRFKKLLKKPLGLSLGVLLLSLVALLILPSAGAGQCPYETENDCWMDCRMMGRDSPAKEKGISCDEYCDKLCAWDTEPEEPQPDCPEYLCRGDVLHVRPRYDPASGQCVSNNQFKCPLGCNPQAGRCNKSQLKLQQVLFAPPARVLILNGRDRIRLSGTALFSNPLGEALKGYKIPLELEVLSATGKRLPDLGLRVFPAYVDSTTGFAGKLISERKIAPDVQLDSVHVIVRSRDIPDDALAVAVVSPAPVIKEITREKWNRPRKKAGVWQNSYGIFRVQAQDPDGNISAYILRSRFGQFRFGKQQWSGPDGRTISTRGWDDPSSFRFAWQAPAMTEHMQLDLLRDLRREWMDAARQGAKASLEQAFDTMAASGLGERAAGMIDPEQALAIARAARQGNSGALGWELLKYGLSSNNITGGPYGMINDMIEARQQAGEVWSEVRRHTGTQAAKMGQAYESGHEYYKEEMAVRTFSMLLDGIKLRDGAIEVVEKISGASENKDLKSRLKDIAYNATLNSLQKSLEYVADTYKGAGARLQSTPFFIYVGVQDRDGYWSWRTLVVEVEGYESIIQ